MSLDEARLRAAVNTRAQRLFADGYRSGWLDDHLLEILTPTGETYEVDVVSACCTCSFYKKHGGKFDCKHLLGYEKLLTDQEAMQSHNARQWEALV